MIEAEHLLIVDDDDRICRMLARYLQREGYRVSTAADGVAMWRQLESGQPDLIILDVMLPGIDGITLARELREKTDVGIVMLTGRDDRVDTVVGLEVGADDYVTKPFDNRELLARIRSVLRRLSVRTNGVEENDQTGRVACFDGWRMDLNAFALVSPAGEQARLTTQEFRLLEIFVRNAGHVLSRDRILQRLSSREWLPEDRSVDVMIGRLRKVIEADPAHPKLIRTLRNAGYQFTARVTMQ
ncbi:MAG: response regulator [Gammaproteobacteria bacterium]